MRHKSACGIEKITKTNNGSKKVKSADPSQRYFLVYTYTQSYPERHERFPDLLTVCSGCSLDRAQKPFLAEVNPLTLVALLRLFYVCVFFTPIWKRTDASSTSG